MDLEATLAGVSRNCLRGQPVPADLRALWEATLRGDADLLDAVELTLVDEWGPGFLEGYGEATTAPAASARAHRRMFEQIAFVALTMDGGLLGYWLGDGNRPVGDAPVVELDGEGQYHLRGTSVAEYLLLFSDSHADVTLVRDWLVGHGVPVATQSPQDVRVKQQAFEDPAARSAKYHEEERAKGD